MYESELAGNTKLARAFIALVPVPFEDDWANERVDGVICRN